MLLDAVAMVTAASARTKLMESSGARQDEEDSWPGSGRADSNMRQRAAVIFAIALLPLGAVIVAIAIHAMSPNSTWHVRRGSG
jgi:hypothetical protein